MRAAPQTTFTHLTEHANSSAAAINYAKLKADQTRLMSAKGHQGSGAIAILTAPTLPGSAGPSDADVKAELAHLHIKDTIYNHLVYSRAKNGVGRWGGFYAKTKFDYPEGALEITGNPSRTKAGQPLALVPKPNTYPGYGDCPDMILHYDYVTAQRDIAVTGRDFLIVYNLFSELPTEAAFFRPDGNTPQYSSLKMKPKKMYRISHLVTGMKAFADTFFDPNDWHLQWTAGMWCSGASTVYVAEIDVYEVPSTAK